jgi:hypothetical protein
VGHGERRKLAPANGSQAGIGPPSAGAHTPPGSGSADVRSRHDHHGLLQRGLWDRASPSAKLPEARQSLPARRPPSRCGRPATTRPAHLFSNRIPSCFGGGGKLTFSFCKNASPGGSPACSRRSPRARNWSAFVPCPARPGAAGTVKTTRVGSRCAGLSENSSSLSSCCHQARVRSPTLISSLPDVSKKSPAEKRGEVPRGSKHRHLSSSPGTTTRKLCRVIFLRNGEPLGNYRVAIKGVRFFCRCVACRTLKKPAA